MKLLPRSRWLWNEQETFLYHHLKERLELSVLNYAWPNLRGQVTIQTRSKIVLTDETLRN